MTTTVTDIPYEDVLTTLTCLGSTDAISSKHQSGILSPMELIEALSMIEQVAFNRIKLAQLTEPLFYRGDDKIQYRHFFNSVESEMKDLMSIHFGDHSPSSSEIPKVGFVLTKINNLVVEFIIGQMKQLGPTLDAYDRCKELIDKGIEIILAFDQKQTTSTDTKNAIRLLHRFSRQRYQSNKNTPLDKTTRLKYIKMYANKKTSGSSRFGIVSM